VCRKQVSTKPGVAQIYFPSGPLLLRRSIVLLGTEARLPHGQIHGYVYQVINRGNDRGPVFHEEEDYSIFLDLLAAAKYRHQVKVLAYGSCGHIGRAALKAFRFNTTAIS